MAEVLHQMPPPPPLDSSRQHADPTTGFGDSSAIASTATDASGFQLPTSSADFSSSRPPMDALPGPSFTFPATNEVSKRRSLHTRKPASMALPAFSFNPGAASDTDAGSARSAPSDAPSPFSPQMQSSPSRARHLRAQSELAGNVGFASSVFQRSSTHDAEPNSSREPLQTTSPTRGHRHRRSGAVSSQDLSSLHPSSRQPSIADASSPSLSPPPSFLLGPSQSHASSGRPAAQLLQGTNSAATSGTSSPMRVSFKDRVEVIPRRSLPTLSHPSETIPARLIHSSDGRDGVRHPDTVISEPQEISLLPASQSWFQEDDECSDGMPAELLQASDSTPAINPVFGDAPDSSLGLPNIPGSCAYPDDEDYTNSSFGEPGFATVAEDFDGVSVTEVTEPGPVAISPATWTAQKQDNAPDSMDSVLDLDTALDTSPSLPSTGLSSKAMRDLRCKSFSAGRRSMHSSGIPSTAPLPLHRRTESAPNLPSFDRPAFPRLNSASASEKGFEMENVFEEDEEEDAEDEAPFVTPQTIPSTPMTSDPPRTPLEDIEERLSSDSHREAALPASGAINDVGTSMKAFRRETTRSDGFVNEPAIRDSVTTITPALIVQAMGSRPSIPPGESRAINSRPETPAASRETGPSSVSEGYPGENVSSQFSEVSSYAEANHAGPLRAPFDSRRLSSDAASSLVSNHSTMASGAHRQDSAAASPLTAVSSTMGGPPSSSGSAHTRWRKRSSLVSLSRLMSANGSAKSHLSEEFIPRCQTSDGLGSESQPVREVSGKRKRLSRLFHIFRHNKDSNEASVG